MKSPKLISIGRGLVAQVSDEDFERVSANRWTVTDNGSGAFRGSRNPKLYARRVVRGSDGVQRTIYLHRFIMEAPSGLVVDHIDGDGLNCTRENLRLCSAAENNRPNWFVKRRAEEPCL
jgi:hypothetical protein